MLNTNNFIRLQKGYTLIELMSVISIAIITTGIVVPSFASILNRNQQIASVNQFSTNLAHARYQAINRYEHIVLCPSVNLSHCSNANEWEHGYISFIDTNENKEVDEQEEILTATQKMDYLIKIKSSSNRKKITFSPSGAAPGSNTTIQFCSGFGDIEHRALILSNSGRARLSKKMPNGEEITCS